MLPGGSCVSCVRARPHDLLHEAAPFPTPTPTPPRRPARVPSVCQASALISPSALSWAVEQLVRHPDRSWRSLSHDPAHDDTPAVCVSGMGAATGMLPSSSQAQTKTTSPSSPDLESLECGAPFEEPRVLKPASPCCGGLGVGLSSPEEGGSSAHPTLLLRICCRKDVSAASSPDESIRELAGYQV